MKIFVQGGNIITSQGDLQETWSSLLNGNSPKNHTPKGYNQSFPLAVIEELDQKIGTTKRLRRLLNKLYLSLPDISSDTALICATTKGAIDEIFTDQSPSSGQIWQIADEIKQSLNLKNDANCISAACASGTIAITQGAMKIANGECDNALIVGIDLISDFVLSGFASLKALSPNCCRPFDRNRNGLTLGEGAGWLLLSKTPRTFSTTEKIYSLSSWGISCDATHITAPCRYGSGLIRTIKQTMSCISVQPGGINAHGTGTFYNDAMELLAFNSIWHSPPPICSVKGTIGHCLGAAGVIESCLSIKSLETGYLPPTSGLISPEENAEKIISGTSPLKLQNLSILSCNSGFGGINAALLFKEEKPSDIDNM